jgi:hypothetical protein
VSKPDTITIDDVKYVRADAQSFGVPEKVQKEVASTYFEIGKGYLIRTVTMIDTGRVVAVNEHEIVLEDAAWIADTGRFADALKAAKFNEVEPFPDGFVIIGRGSVIDAVRFDKLPRDQK